MKKIIIFSTFFSVFTLGMNKEFFLILPGDVSKIIFDYYHHKNKNYKDIYLVNKNFNEFFSSIRTDLIVRFIYTQSTPNIIKKKIYTNTKFIGKIRGVGYVFNILSRKILYNSFHRFEDLYGRFKNIKSLKLSSCCQLDDEDFKCITLLNNLQNFSIPGINDKRVQYISNLISLQKLNLSDDEITDEGINHISGLINMRTLILGSKKISDEGIKHISMLLNMRTLVINGPKISNEGIRYLSHNSKIEGLYLTGLNITDEDLNHLSWFTNIKGFYLQDCAKVSCKGLISLTSLTFLGMIGNPSFTDEVIKNCSVITNLKHICIYNCEISNDGLLYLSIFKNLEVLDLPYYSVASNKIIKCIRNLTNLKKLWIENFCSNEEDFQFLLKELPNFKGEKHSIGYEFYINESIKNLASPI